MIERIYNKKENPILILQYKTSDKPVILDKDEIFRKTNISPDKKYIIMSGNHAEETDFVGYLCTSLGYYIYSIYEKTIYIYNDNTMYIEV